MSAERKVYTLTQLNQSLENHFWSQFGERTFWVTAEIVKVNQKGGHYYLELADSRNNVMTAKSFATIWSRTYRLIQDQIGATELAGILKPGNDVLFALKIEFHAVYGLKLNVLNIDPTFSYGAIEKKRKEVIKKLKKEGRLEKQKEIKLPVIIKRIALIGSPDTSGFTDFKEELLNNHSYNKFKIIVFPVRVQGEYAAKEIANAVSEASCYDVDAIVLLRGGGSKMDLSIFDDYLIARSISDSRIPVLTGIGHETDRVVADLAAHTYFKTPTAVAAHIHYAISSFWEIMRDYHDKVIHRAQQMISTEREAFTHLNNYLQHYSRAMIQHWRTVFQQFENDVSAVSYNLVHETKREQDKLIHELIYQVERNVQDQRNKIDRTLDDVLVSSMNTVDNERRFALEYLLENIQSYGSNQIDRARINLENLNELLTLLNPNKMLDSGYTISTVDEQDVQTITADLIGKEMKTLTGKQLISSTIKSVKKIEK